MSKFQPPMLNDDACRVSTDKQTHKHTHTHTYKKHTYWVKTEETFFYRQVFYILFFFCNSLKVKKDGFQQNKQKAELERNPLLAKKLNIFYARCIILHDIQIVTINHYKQHFQACLFGSFRV